MRKIQAGILLVIYILVSIYLISSGAIFTLTGAGIFLLATLFTGLPAGHYLFRKG